MKKALLILASVAMASTVAMADVESQNMVGFSKASVPSNGFWMVSCNFQTTDGSNQVSIQDLFPAEELFHDSGNNGAMCDQIMVYDGSNYTAFVYNKLFDYDLEDYVGQPMWVYQNAPATLMFKRGDGFWYKRSQISPITTLTVKGQAPVDASIAHDSLPVGFMIFGNAYPNSTAITNLSINAYHDPSNNGANCDQIMVYDGTNYTAYVFNKLFDYDLEDYVGEPTWVYQNAPAADLLPVGRAAWYKRSANAGGPATWTEAKPY